MLTLVRLVIVLIMMEDRCTVCVKKQLALKLFWMHPTELLGDVGHVESCCGLFGDSVTVGVR
jgi:hypothetical protein